VVDDAVSLTRTAGKRKRYRLCERRSAIHAQTAPGAAVSCPAGGSGESRGRASLPRDHLVTSRVARGAMAGSRRLRPSRRVGAVQQRPGSADTECQPPARHA
jgi:hypothetical protein